MSAQIHDGIVLNGRCNNCGVRTTAPENSTHACTGGLFCPYCNKHTFRLNGACRDCGRTIPEPKNCPHALGVIEGENRCSKCGWQFPARCTSSEYRCTSEYRCARCSVIVAPHEGHSRTKCDANLGAGSSVHLVGGGKQTFSTGAVRSADAAKVRYDLITPIGLRRVAEAYAEGAVKYAPFNWEKGMPVDDLLNHAIRHLFEFLVGDRTEDHLGHAAWNVLAACHSDEAWPDLNKELTAARERREATRKKEDPIR